MDVVFIVLDTLRRDHLSIYDDDVGFTGTLDRIARDAVVFDDAVAQAPWSFPSHASMFTGLYPWEHRATQASLRLSVDRPLLAERFAAAGYRTAAFHRNGWLSPVLGMMRGIDHLHQDHPIMDRHAGRAAAPALWRLLGTAHLDPVQRRLLLAVSTLNLRRDRRPGTDSTDLIAALTRFAEQHRGEDTFLFLNMMDAHYPYTPPRDVLDRHAPGLALDDIASRPWEYGGPVDPREMDAVNALYDASVDHMDDQLDALFTFYRETGRMDDTVFIIAGDHGEHLGEDGMMGHHFSVADPLISVPLLVRHPDMAGTRIDRQVELRELYDLIPGYAGIAPQPEPGTRVARGGYDRPAVYRHVLPPEKRAAFDHSLRFTREDGETTVETDAW